MATERKGSSPLGEVAEFAEQAAEGILGAEVLAGFGGRDILKGLWQITQQAAKSPKAVLEQEAAFVRQLTRILAGDSDLAAEPGDRRFEDSVWKNNPFYRACMQSYLAWRKSMQDLIDAMGFDRLNAERAHFIVSLLTEALSPTNTLVGNPAALKKFFDSGGRSVLSGVKQLVQDMLHNGGMPAQVDKSKFQVGKNLALSAGAVVFKNEVLELIQYQPKTEAVYSRPLLILPPPINKFYIFDLSPVKSVVDYALGSGLSTFAISWRNPTKAQKDWGLDTYVLAALDAIEAIREITGADDVNIMGTCVGGVTIAVLLGYLAAKGERRLHSATLMVAILDTETESQLGLFMSPETVKLAKLNSQRKGVLGGDEMGQVFAWLRPNELVWNYWVNNYLLGNPPPAFDLLYWNNDTTRLPAKLHGELLDFGLTNPLKTPGQMKVLGTPIDLSKVTCDLYLVAGMTDHITPWPGVYRSMQMFGGQAEFILSSSGHMQSVINPPGNPRAKYFHNRQLPASSDEWLAGAEQHADSWWTHWREWISQRSGSRVPAPAALGSEQYPPLYAAPGRYVFEP